MINPLRITKEAQRLFQVSRLIFILIVLFMFPRVAWADAPAPDLYDTTVSAPTSPQAHTPLPAPAPPIPLPATVWRIGVTADGLYVLDYATLSAAGVPVTTTPPADLHLTWRGQPVALDSVGTADGTFDPGDAFVFYGEKFHGSRQDEKYTDENVYWLSVDASTPGLRMTTRSVTPAASPTGVCTGTVIAEENNEYWGRWSTAPGTDATWFWQRTSLPSGEITRTYPISLTAPLNAGPEATLIVEVAARNENTTLAPDHHLRLTFNDTPLGEVYWEGKIGHIITRTVPAAALLAGGNALHVTLMADDAHQDIYFDRAALNYRHTAQATCTRVAASKTTYAFSAPATARPYDVSDPRHPIALTGYDYTAGTLAFSDAAPVGARYLAEVARPITPTYYTPALDLIAPTTGADEIIIAPQEFITALHPLVAQRESQGLRVRVVDVADVYPLFNGGIYHPEAIRALVAHAYAHWPGPPPAYLLLVSDGNFNLKGYNPSTYGTHAPSPIPPYLAFADPYQGEVPLDLRFGDVVAHAAPGDDAMPEVVVGRIPAATVADVQAVVAKTLAYENAPAAAWQLRALLVADNIPDAAGDFPGVLNRLVTDIITPHLHVERVYLDDYCDTPSGTACPSGSFALTTTWGTGVGLVTYSGHASINRWAHEKFLRTSHIPTFTPTTQLPFAMSLDCLDGNWIFPPNYPGLNNETRAIAEQLIIAPERGAVAAFSPAGLSYTWDGELIARAVYAALLAEGELRVAELSQIARKASRTHLRQVYTLFGDPALVLSLGDEITLSPRTTTTNSVSAGGVVSLTTLFNAQLHTRFGKAVPLKASAWTADAGTFDAHGNYYAPTTATVAHLTAHLGVLSATLPLTITAGPPVTVTVAPHPVRLEPGEQLQMTATARDAYRNPTPATGPVTWTTNLGDITSTGLFTAAATGKTGRITATLVISRGTQIVHLTNFADVALVTWTRVYLPLVMRGLKPAAEG